MIKKICIALLMFLFAAGAFAQTKVAKTRVIITPMAKLMTNVRWFVAYCMPMTGILKALLPPVRNTTGMATNGQVTTG